MKDKINELALGTRKKRNARELYTGCVLMRLTVISARVNIGPIRSHFRLV
jgi:hypothetical protein